MKKKLILLAILVVGSTMMSQRIYAQSESFDKGLIAMQEGRNMEALKLFQNAVLHEKFLMKGKDIPLAYAYMALIRNEFLEKKLENGTFITVQQNPGVLKSSIADINSAMAFHDKSANAEIQKAKKKLIKNATEIGKIVIDSLLKHDYENHPQAVLDLAAILNFELKDLSSIESDNWELHDILGFTHYMLGEMDLAMLEFKRGREIYNSTSETDLSKLHLFNCTFSAKYLYKETKNYTEAYAAATDGKALVNRMMQATVSNDINVLRDFSALDGTFSSIQSRIENMTSISSTKE